jgi:hypothetical protein
LYRSTAAAGFFSLDLLQWVTLDLDLHVNEHFRFFAQGISGIQYGGEREKSPVNEDPIDLQQAFVDFGSTKKMRQSPPTR